MLKIALSLVALIVSTGGGAYIGYEFAHGQDASYQAGVQQAENTALKLAADDQRKRDAITLRAALNGAAHREKIVTQYATITKEVTRYVPAKADAECVVPNGFVRLFDAAASQTDPDALPATAGEPDGSPSGIALSQVGALSVAWAKNYAIVAQQLTDLQDHDRAQAAQNVANNIVAPSGGIYVADVTPIRGSDRGYHADTGAGRRIGANGGFGSVALLSLPDAGRPEDGTRTERVPYGHRY